MAVKQLSDLTVAGDIGDGDLLLIRQGGEDKKIKAAELAFTLDKYTDYEKIGDGFWASGKTFTSYNGYMIYNGEAYIPLGGTSLPYTIGAIPDLGFVYKIQLNSHPDLSGRNPADGSAHNANDIGRGASTVDADLTALENKTITDNYFYTQMGKAFDSTDGAGDPFASWTHATVAYDESEDNLVVFYNTNAGHSINTNSVMMRKKKTNSDAFTAVKVVASDSGNFSYKCQAAGIAANGDYVALVARFPWSTGDSDATYIYRSTDHGVTFTPTLMQSGGSNVIAYNGDVSGFLLTLSGRICTFAVEYGTFLSRIFYSDDNGATWSQSSIAGTQTDVTEPAWCDIGDNKLVCMARAAVRFGNTSQVIPAKFMTSSDNGATWTEPVDSTSITNFTLSNGEMIPNYESKQIEFIHHSRFTEADNFSSLLQSTASFDDAYTDNFSKQVRIGKLAAYTEMGTSTGDSGYVGAKKSSNGVITAFYYTGARISAQINYLVGTPDTAYSSAGNVIDPRTGDSLLSPDTASGLFTSILSSGNINPRLPTGFIQGFNQGTVSMSQVTSLVSVTGTDGVTTRRSSYRTTQTIAFADVNKIILSLLSFDGTDVAIALYDTETVNEANPVAGRKFYSATNKAGDFVVDVSGINGTYYLHIILNSKTNVSISFSGIHLIKDTNTPIYKQTPDKGVWDGGFKLAARTGATASILVGSGSGTTDLTSLIAHGATSFGDVFSRAYIINLPIPAGVTTVSARVMLPVSVSSANFETGLAIYDKATPTSPTDGRVASSFVSGTGGLVTVSVPSGSPRYLALISTAKVTGASAAAYFDEIFYY